MMDFTVTSYVPAINGINQDDLEDFLSHLLKAVHPEVEVIGFAEGNENAEGINALQVRTYLNKATQDALEATLKRKFGQPFEISYTKESPFLNRADAIAKAASSYIRKIH